MRLGKYAFLTEITKILPFEVIRICDLISKEILPIYIPAYLCDFIDDDSVEYCKAKAPITRKNTELMFEKYDLIGKDDNIIRSTKGDLKINLRNEHDVQFKLADIIELLSLICPEEKIPKEYLQELKTSIERRKTEDDLQLALKKAKLMDRPRILREHGPKLSRKPAPITMIIKDAINSIAKAKPERPMSIKLKDVLEYIKTAVVADPEQVLPDGQSYAYYVHKVTVAGQIAGIKMKDRLSLDGHVKAKGRWYSKEYLSSKISRVKK